MDRRYLNFCGVDPLFYDLPDAARPLSAGVGDFSELVARPADWREAINLSWRSLAPADTVMPEQGWKVHVSATMHNAERVLRVVADYCMTEGVPFKHLPSRRVLLARNSKYADRAASGKFMTLYPGNDNDLAVILRELSPLVASEPGPYILTDLRIGDGPLYVRYGGFVRRWMERDGQRVPAISRPDGTLVPDPREPRFIIPEFVQPPACLSPHLEARRSADPTDFPYTITSAVHFSNGGGIYRAHPRIDAPGDDQPDRPSIVLKEGRPYAGLDGAGQDAVTRLDHEHAVLTRLAGVAAVPEVGDPFTVHGHRFLPLQAMPGITLSNWVVRHYPLVAADPDPEAVDDYSTRALAIGDRIAAVLAEIHSHGLAVVDLHPRNVLIDEQDHVSLIDFELADEADATRLRAMGAPGFAAPAGLTGAAADQYALAMLRLWMFQPTVSILDLSREPLARWIDHIEQRFALPPVWTSRLRARVLLEPPDRLASAEPGTCQNGDPRAGLCSGLVAGILASATPERPDRLFPGDIRQFDVDGLCLGFGAAGVLHALRVADAGAFPDHERWLLDALARNPPRRTGLWEGAHGIAYVLDGLGHPDEADQVLATAGNHQSDPATDHSVRRGLAGAGLVLLHLAERRADDQLRAQGLALADTLVDHRSA